MYLLFDREVLANMSMNAFEVVNRESFRQSNFEVYNCFSDGGS